MKKYTTTIFISFFAMFLFSSCKEDRNGLLVETYNTNNIIFEPTFDKPYTTELEHYQFALRGWSNGVYTKGLAHFPKYLDKDLKYSFFYLPPVMQGGAFIELKIDFLTEEAGLDYFEQHSKGYKQGFDSMKQYRESDYCSELYFGFDKDYSMETIECIRLLLPVVCSGKHLKGGISSAIFIEKSHKTVLCISRDLRL